MIYASFSVTFVLRRRWRVSVPAKSSGNIIKYNYPPYLPSLTMRHRWYIVDISRTGSRIIMRYITSVVCISYFTTVFLRSRTFGFRVARSSSKASRNAGYRCKYVCTLFCHGFSTAAIFKKKKKNTTRMIISTVFGTPIKNQIYAI